jgi:hypothetical protein
MEKAVGRKALAARMLTGPATFRYTLCGPGWQLEVGEGPSPGSNMRSRHRHHDRGEDRCCTVTWFPLRVYVMTNIRMGYRKLIMMDRQARGQFVVMI